jgi:hypothetical protein
VVATFSQKRPPGGWFGSFIIPRASRAHAGGDYARGAEPFVQITARPYSVLI